MIIGHNSTIDLTYLDHREWLESVGFRAPPGLDFGDPILGSDIVTTLSSVLCSLLISKPLIRYERRNQHFKKTTFHPKFRSKFFIPPSSFMGPPRPNKRLIRLVFCETGTYYNASFHHEDCVKGVSFAN